MNSKNVIKETFLLKTCIPYSVNVDINGGMARFALPETHIISSFLASYTLSGMPAGICLNKIDKSVDQIVSLVSVNCETSPHVDLAHLCISLSLSHTEGALWLQGSVWEGRGRQQMMTFLSANPMALRAEIQPLRDVPFKVGCG